MKFIYKSGKLILVTLFFILIAYYLYKNSDTIRYLKNLSANNIFLLFVTRLTLLLGNGYLLKVFAQKFSIILKTKEWTGLAFITGLGNYIAPLSFGMVIRAAYLKRKHDFPYTLFITVLGSTYLINFLCVGIIGFCSSLFLYNSFHLSWQLPVIFALFILSIIIIIKIKWKISYSRIRIINKIVQAIEGWNTIRNDFKLISKVIGITFFNIFFNGLSYWIAYNSLGICVNFFQSMIISLIGIFSLLINITPANLGIQEIIIGIASEYILVDAGAEGLLVAVVIRSVTILLVFTLGPLYSAILANDLGINFKGIFSTK